MKRNQLDAMQPAKDEVDFSRDMADGICSFCREPVSMGDGFVNFATERDGKLYYPSRDADGGFPVAFYAHAECGPDRFYWFPLDRIEWEVLDREYGLIEHVRTKHWASSVYEIALRVAKKLTVDLKRKPKASPPRIKSVAKEFGGIDKLLEAAGEAFDLAVDEPEDA